MDATEIFDDPAFMRLLNKRSKLRWGFSTFLIGAYLGYGMAGLLFPDAYATAVFNSSIPLGMALGFALIGSSVAMSMIYVRIINRLEANSKFVVDSSQ